MLQNFSFWREVTKEFFFLIITSIFKTFGKHSAVHASFHSYSKVPTTPIQKF